MIILSLTAASYTVSVDDPIMIRSSNNKPVRVASTNTWFSLIRFTAPSGTEITFDFTEIFFTDNTKVSFLSMMMMIMTTVTGVKSALEFIFMGALYSLMAIEQADPPPAKLRQ